MSPVRATLLWFSVSIGADVSLGMAGGFLGASFPYSGCVLGSSQLGQRWHQEGEQA